MIGDGLRIDVRQLTKRFGSVTAVSDLTFSVAPGVVTGFLGPNGAGKTTTMRMILGLVEPTAGVATIGGTRYCDLPQPPVTVGAVLDGASGAHPACSGRDHLRIYATMSRLPLHRVDAVLDQLRLTAFADRPAGEYSTGMRQRLSLATALLGDPRVLLLDEPGNGLDPQGMAWLRDLLQGLAAEGRTILVSSHVLSEIEQIAADVVVIRDGQLVTPASVAELSIAAGAAVLVRSPEAERLAHALGARTALTGGVIERKGVDLLRVTGFSTVAIAELAAAHGLAVHELTPERSGLEQIFLTLTAHTERALS
ncbi:ABC transporter ATP-binding protein [Micromonospora ureilytica]|uniref:ABC-2 type transport system ATP-binding protein n=1 Tax=Micromonospora ureilytica TaxID=709868 RepID=A0ABS0JD95_9ACTN|nr:ATP-binding cassette domain-containing protein [Micromonospora ureilytica]MBG6064951.1 ABC-2 type transport system ATP-binding protein [Micromonospora ureilytica]